MQQLITLRNDKQNLESVNNRLQHKLKDINDEFRSRLVKYVEDIAVSHWGSIYHAEVQCSLG